MISLTSPVRTRAHDWPAGAKLGALLLVTIGLAATDALPLLALAFAGMVGLYALPGRIFLLHGARRLRMLLPIVAVVLIWHVVVQDARTGMAISLRLLTAVGLANLVTMTTRLSDMMAVVRTLCRPLARLGLNVRAMDIAIALVIRMIPVLSDTGHQLGQSWAARSPKKPRWRIVMPLTLATLDDADHVAEALKARGGIQPPPASPPKTSPNTAPQTADSRTSHERKRPWKSQ
ncbi:energy-coupling factor transporter transmembrane component T [Pseudooceanicola sp. HF7]|uniref:energy-coupling factor transporter transmembrane component T family protein n=1 Tax=Pseudooceanicola sp. HF7 TaxID=2721560 RepID=UPI0014312EEE|nr:energy-coupling factor transporter transmembrane protein EcfT [Pseudooceanicola sp. HF7]